MATEAPAHWNEINEYARHWEKLVFENAKNFFTVVSLALGAAGAVLAWSTVTRPTQKLVIFLFLATAIAVSWFALKAIRSTKNYLSGFYARRRAIEQQIPELKLKEDVPGSGSTLDALAACFWVAIVLSALLIVVTVTALEPSRSFLEGARLSGADLSIVRGLTQKDLDGACGDALTRLQTGLTIRQCPEPSVQGKPAAQPSAAGDAPQAARP